MASPTPRVLDWIRGRVANWGPSDAEIAAALNAPTVPNPEEPASIPKAVSTLVIINLISTESFANLEQAHLLTTINTALGLGRREELLGWVVYCKRQGHITVEEETALLTELTATIPDPAYQAEVPEAVAEFGRELDADDVRAARPQEGDSE